jgi:hypothetical protein
MAQRKPDEKVTLDQVLQLVDKLTAEEQKRLRQVLLEDEEDIRICLERLEDPHTISHEELKKQLAWQIEWEVRASRELLKLELPIAGKFTTDERSLVSWVRRF